MSDDPAKQRYMILNLVRLTGAGLALLGLLIIGGRFELPLAAGYVLFLAGLFDMMFVPMLLARRWKSPPQ